MLYFIAYLKKFFLLTIYGQCSACLLAYLLYNTLTPFHLALQCTTFPSAFSPYISSPRFHKSHQSLKHRRHLFSPPSSLPLSLLPRPPYRPNILRTPSLTCLSYSTLCSLHIFAASTFAGLSSFGSANMLITLIKIFSTLWIGDHRSEACS